VSKNSLKRAKIIRDPVHGYIDLDNLAFDLINTGAFRRLRWVNQHGLAHFVYPGATITRMTHSIGVYHIAKQYFESIINNTKEEILRKIFGKDQGEKVNREKIRNIYLPILEAAALLHDIGHGPFSHASEPVLKRIYEDKCLDSLNSLLDNSAIDKDKSKTHECITYYIIEKNKEIEDILKNYDIEKRDVISVLVGRKVKGSSLNDDQIRVLNYIISSNIDADRLDFVLRDSYFLGVPYGLTDVERIIRVARIELKDGKPVLAYDIRGLSAIEHFLFARTHMYRWVFYHHIITLLDSLVLPTAIAISHGVKCLSFPDLDILAKNPYERYPKDYDVLKVLKCTIEKIRNTIYCYNQKNEEAREVKSIDECKDGRIIFSKSIEKLIDSINNRRLLPKALWKRYEGMVSEISDYINSEINRKFEECQQSLIKKGQYEALPNLGMQYSTLLRNRYFVFSELNSILGNREEKEKMMTNIMKALKEAGVTGAFYFATRSVKFYDDEKPIYISDRENIREIDKVSSTAGELAQILRMHMFFSYYMDPDKNNRDEYLMHDEAKRIYNIVTDTIKQYLIDKIIKDRFSNFGC